MTITARLLEAAKPSRRRTRTLLQMEAVECGAAALGSILGYHGRIVPLEELRVACGVSRDGVTAKNIVRAARTYGLVAKGYRKEIEDLRDLELPVILFWNFNHFLVLEGFTRDGSRVYINDPAVGPRVVSWDELDHAYTGVVLTFTAGPDFQPGGTAPGIVDSLRRRLEGSEVALAFVVLAGLGLVVPGLVIPAFARIFVDNILVAGLESWIQPLLIGLALTAILRAVLTWLRERYLLRLETKLAVAGAGPFFWHVLQLPVDFFAQRYAGEVATRVGLNDRVAQVLSGRLASTVVDLAMIVFFGALMLVYDWLLTLIALAAVVASLLALRAVSRIRVDANRRLLQEDGKFRGALMAGLQNIDTVKATSGETDLFALLAGHMAKVVNSSQELYVNTSFFMSIPSLANGLATVLVLGVGGYQVMRGELTMGMLVAFQTLLASFMAPVNGMIQLGSEVQELEGSMNRLDDVLRHPVDIRVGEHLKDGRPANGDRGPSEVEGSFQKLSGRVELRDVTFGYSRLAAPLITELNLKLEPGARVALVGSSGSGKSTVSKLVCQLYQPWDGEVLFDRTPAGEWNRGVLASSLSFVDQDLVLFDGTIRENLTLWDRTVPEEDVVRAAKDALIHEAIMARPGGYDSPLEEGGRNFSGGQQQRLDIARALVRNPRILVLDEATSALDPVAEARIDENIRRRGCTSIIVAHRLSTIRDADEILVLEEGRVAERGTHDDLVSDTDGLYRRLIQA